MTVTGGVCLGVYGKGRGVFASRQVLPAGVPLAKMLTKASGQAIS